MIYRMKYERYWELRHPRGLGYKPMSHDDIITSLNEALGYERLKPITDDIFETPKGKPVIRQKPKPFIEDVSLY